MTSSMVRRDDCRLCGSRDLTQVLSLCPTPPANAFVDTDRRGQPQPEFPLDLWLCGACGHVQLRDVVDPKALFSDYVYATGLWPAVRSYFEEYAAGLVGEFGLQADDLAIDIGSNDGTLLRLLRTVGMRTVGIDPARNIALAANDQGIETIAEFFTAKRAADIRRQYGAAACVTANNVLAHIDDLADVAAGVRTLLAPAGVFVFEVSYLVDLYRKALFDTIYHEHLSYHSVAPLVGFFAGHGLQLIDLARTPGQGGSLRGVVQLAGGPRAVSRHVDEAIAAEASLRLNNRETWQEFARRIESLDEQLRHVIRDVRANGKRIAGLGAPAKATTLMYQFGLGPDDIEAVYDDSPLKQNLFTPGLHLPVLPTAAIAEGRPDYLLILAWNHAETLMTQQQGFHQAGGRFIVPLPTVEVR
jgi:SAM-dependent methyltransferase